MNKRSDIENKVNQALESLDGIQRAEPVPFLFTRVKARLEREQHNIWETAESVLARPAIAFAGLFLILAVNAYILFERDTSVQPSQPSAYSAQLTEEEYVLTANNTSYDYENIEP